jgi:interferon gamma-inducible protein 30
MIKPIHVAGGLTVTLILWIVLVFARPAPQAASTPDGTTVSSIFGSEGQLVKVDFYGESLCPDCQHMVVDVLSPLFKSGVSKLLALRYIALGNVRGSPDDAAGVQCQHGPGECLHNRYINCAQQAQPDQDKWFPYVECLATNMRDIAAERDACARKAGLDAAALQSCAEGKAGAALERRAYEETLALQPKHTFVPWVVVNGVALGGAFEDLDRYVCVAADPAAR